MCLFVVLREVVPGWPLVVVANRDEFYDRPSKSPHLLDQNPSVFGGCDLRAGGTWLAVNSKGMICAITNRSQNKPTSKNVRSRGLLCLDAARQSSPIAVADMIGRALGENDYHGFNLICASVSGGSVFYFDGTLREKPLGRGAAVITTGDANDLSIAKVKRAHDILKSENAQSTTEWFQILEALCRDHDGGTGSAKTLCAHGKEKGTVSSIILAIHQNDPSLHTFRYCAGRPCESSYAILPWPDFFFTTMAPASSARTR